MGLEVHFDEAKWEPFSDSIMEATRKFLESEEIQQAIEDLSEKLDRIIEQKTGEPPASRRLAIIVPRVTQKDHERAEREGIPHLLLEIRVACREWYKFFWHQIPPHTVRKMEVPAEDPIVYLPEAPWTTWILEGDTHGISRDELLGKYLLRSEAVSMVQKYLDRIVFLEAQVKPKRNGRTIRTEGPRM
jgi:hypothetical protein